MSQEPDKKQPVRRRESFDLVAQDYDLYHSPYPQEVETRRWVVSTSPRQQRLEIGCGTGQLSARWRSSASTSWQSSSASPCRSRQSTPATVSHAQVEVGRLKRGPYRVSRLMRGERQRFHWLDPAFASQSRRGLRQEVT